MTGNFRTMSVVAISPQEKDWQNWPRCSMLSQQQSEIQFGVGAKQQADSTGLSGIFLPKKEKGRFYNWKIWPAVSSVGMRQRFGRPASTGRFTSRPLLGAIMAVDAFNPAVSTNLVGYAYKTMTFHLYRSVRSSTVKGMTDVPAGINPRICSFDALTEAGTQIAG